MMHYSKTSKSNIYNSDRYKIIFSNFVEYVIIIGFIVLQLTKPDAKSFFQESLFNYTGWIIKSSQSRISKVDEFLYKIKNIDIIQDTDKYNKLQNENTALKARIAIQEKELAKIAESSNIINANFGIIKTENYIICSVSFYLNGDSKMIICNALMDKEVEIKRNSLVINNYGLVGRVLENYDKFDPKNNIKIQLIEDIGFRIPIISGISFTRGIAMGSGINREMQIMYSDSTQFINQEPIFTSNDGNVVTPEIPIGNVAINENGAYVVKITNQIYNLAFLKIML